jgi:hypothetical protein
MTIYALLFVHDACIIGVKLSSTEPEMGLCTFDYLLYRCELDGDGAPMLIGRNG